MLNPSEIVSVTIQAEDMNEEQDNEDEEENDEPAMGKMYMPSAVWRRERAMSIIISTCTLLEDAVSDEQKEHLRQILFDGLRLYLQANQEIKPGCMLLFLPIKIWSHRQEMLDHVDPALELMERLVAAPQDCVTVLEDIDRLFPQWFKNLSKNEEK